MSDTKLFDTNSEAIVIATILQNPSLVHSMDGLRAYMFSSIPHVTIVQEFEELKEKQYLPDPDLVIASLESKQILEKAGGKNYIDILLKKEVKSESLTEFIGIVIASYKARSFISVLSGVKKDNLNSTNIDETISATRKSLDTLIEMQAESSIVSLGEVTKEAYDEIMSRTEKPGIRGASWGIDNLDKATGGKYGGDLWVIGGRPGQGKTALICNSLLADAEAGIPSLILEREMRRQELIERFICIKTGIPNTNIQLGILDNKQREHIRDTLADLKKLPLYIDTNFALNDPLYFESVIQKYVHRNGVKNIYLDYIQIATERDDGQTQAIGRLSRLGKLLANELNICFIMLSQLNRAVEAREDKRPIMSDMKQSGALEEDPDFVVGLYRDDYYYKETKNKGLMEYIILKHRNGPPGTVTLRFNGATSKIGEA